jgi:signal recognition particle subunit SRP19
MNGRVIRGMPDHFFVYPAYLHRGRTRAGGRRVPLSLGVPSEVSATDIVEAARRLGWQAEIEQDKAYPRTAFEGTGRVRVRKAPGLTKSEALRRLAREIPKITAKSG